MTMIYTYDGSTSSCNLTSAATLNACDQFYYFKQTLKQAGWTVTKSSDGTTVNASGDRITGYATGSAGLNNSGAWYVLQAPGAVAGATRQICVQRYTVAYSFTVTYSYSAGFTGGSATVAPTATDSQTMAACSFSSSATYRFSIGADNASPYGFYMFAFPTGGGNPYSCLIMDPLAAGTYNSSDVDPYILYSPGFSIGVGQSSPLLYTGITAETAAPYSFYKKGLSGEGFVLTPGQKYTSLIRTVIPGALGANPYSSKDNIFPIAYLRRSAFAAPNGWKGIGTFMKWIGTSRTTGDTLSISATGAKDYIVVSPGVALPWNGSTPTV